VGLIYVSGTTLTNRSTGGCHAGMNFCFAAFLTVTAPVSSAVEPVEKVMLLH